MASQFRYTDLRGSYGIRTNLNAFWSTMFQTPRRGRLECITLNGYEERSDGTEEGVSEFGLKFRYVLPRTGVPTRFPYGSRGSPFYIDFAVTRGILDILRYGRLLRSSIRHKHSNSLVNPFVKQNLLIKVHFPWSRCCH